MANVSCISLSVLLFSITRYTNRPPKRRATHHTPPRCWVDTRRHASVTLTPSRDRDESVSRRSLRARSTAGSICEPSRAGDRGKLARAEVSVDDRLDEKAPRRGSGHQSRGSERALYRLPACQPKSGGGGVGLGSFQAGVTLGLGLGLGLGLELGLGLGLGVEARRVEKRRKRAVQWIFDDTP